MQKEATDEDVREVIKFYISVKQDEILSYEEKIGKCLDEIEKFEELLAYVNNRIAGKKKEEN